MKNIILLIIGIIIGYALQFWSPSQSKYLVLSRDYVIEGVGQIKKGTHLKIAKGYPEGFMQYYLILNLKYSEEDSVFVSNVGNLTIPYWLNPE